MIFDYDANLIASKKYAISNYGRVKNIDTDSLLKTFKNKEGYLLIIITEPGYRKMKIQIHRLVGYTFIPNPNNLPQIKHKRIGDDFKDLNHTDNLEWCTISEDIKCLRRPRNSEVFSIWELYKIRELVRMNGWSTTSILVELGYHRASEKLKKRIKIIYERTAHN